MRPSYSQLIDEHAIIEAAANDLMADVRDEEVGASRLATQLDELARTVESHIEVEDGVITGFNLGLLIGPWFDAWADGVSAFERLKADWLLFLGTWTRAAIERDRTGFRRAAEAILVRLRERIQLETQPSTQMHYRRVQSILSSHTCYTGVAAVWVSRERPSFAHTAAD